MSTKNFRVALAALGAISAVLLIVVIVLSVLLGNSSSSDSSDPDSNLCTSVSCINAAKLILNNIDEKADPCEDFNKFSCGNFIKNRRIPDDASSTDAFTDLRTALSYALSDALASYTNDDIEATTNAKSYYYSCLNEDSLEANGERSLIDAIKREFGGWSLLDSTYKVDKDEFFQKLIKFGKMNTKSFFDVFITESPKNPKHYTLRLQQPNWFLLKEKYDDAKTLTAYKHFAKHIVNNLNEFQETTVDQAAIESMIDLERTIALYQLTQNEKRNQKFKNITIEELNLDITGFNWEDYIVNGLFKDFPDVKVTNEERILVEDPAYLKNFTKIYTDSINDAQKLKTLDNLLVWSFVKSKTGFLPKTYRDAQQDFDKVYSGTTTTPPKSRTCANAIQEKMPHAIGKLYVKNNFDDYSKKAAAEMIENIRAEFKVIVEEIGWMDKESKVPVREKADAIDVKIGFPDYYKNDTYLNEIYANYKFKNDTYLENFITVTREEFSHTFSSLRKEHDTKDWIIGPAIVNAFYSETNNQITFPAGILQAPFYDSGVPRYLNYGGIGSVIGHEITHGFDDQGRKYDKDGIFFDDGEAGLWTNKTIDEYNQHAQCIIDQYSNYVAAQVNMSLIGTQVQGENIADNGGIKESFRAYKRWEKINGKEKLLPGLKYNADQLFFINYAQIWCLKVTDQSLEFRIKNGVHSPGEFRIRGPTSNFKSFSEAFNCKANTGNNPNNKCSVW